ncbi:hypothetical protein FOZ60_012185 [Perkinsus olseni]|uniref:Uncharacterized protein n=1 Tax=Perkinsus olseni TaxID=32597 RepID=A0A7J6P9V8_PEROL|nr:hypothetical protein FOZ60_012185 [Perkinsus olseni]
MLKLVALVTAVAVVTSSVQNEVFSPADGLLEKNVPGTSDILPLIRLRKPRELRDQVVNSTEAGRVPSGDGPPLSWGSSVPESCPAPHHGRAECLSGLCFIALEGGCPPGMKGAAVQGLGKVCMYFY